ncbi:MAG: aminotransferase class V-fold PLP-dependent enzyme [Pseudomonadales bacterium]|nr:aminotransferase class V-fold PLP-dependent enzyme [Pseudomonadales bacterium]
MKTMSPGPEQHDEFHRSFHSPHSSRRQFLQLSSAMLLGGVGTFTANSQGQDGPLLSSEEEYWQQIRAQFAFTEAAVPMNAANLCPSFRAVAESVMLLTADIDRDCSFNNRGKFSGMLAETRKRVADQLRVTPEEVALLRNTSEANNVISNGIPLGSGDEVILWEENHPTNNVAWDVRAARFGFRVIRVATPTVLTADTLLDAFVSRFTEQTRVLALTHVSNVSGIHLPVKELVRAAHARGIHVHVDGAQTWGAMALDLRTLNVDSFAASAHKWYMGPKEVGLLYVKAEHIDRIWPGVVATGWGTDSQTRQPGARKFESLGQRDDAALAGLGVAAEIHQQIGAERIEARIYQLAQRLKTGLLNEGLELLTPLGAELSFGVCIAKAPSDRAGQISNALYTEYGIAGAATGGIRLCPAIYNTFAHVDRAVAGVSALMRAHNLV